MELLLVAIGIGFLCAISLIIFCVDSKNKENTIYCKECKQNNTKGTVKNVNIEGFLK